MGEGGGGEELSSFFASIFPLFPRIPDTQASPQVYFVILFKSNITFERFSKTGEYFPQGGTVQFRWENMGTYF